MSKTVGYWGLLSLMSCVTWSATAKADTTTYDQLYPTYAEVCAVTAEKPKGGSSSGAGGHAVLYLKGVCRDRSAGYPKLRICAPGEVNLDDYNSGTAISVDEVFKNVNWMAIDTRDLLIKGNVADSETLTIATRDRAIHQIVDGGMLDGVLPHDKYMDGKPAGMSDHERMARLGVGLNFGVTFGRNAYCAKMPVPPELLQPMIDILNARNAEFIGGQKEYKWDLLSDNCAHAAHNAVSAAGIFDPYKINAPLPVQLFNLAVPANEYIDWIDFGNNTDLTDVVGVWRDRHLRNPLLERGWMPVGPGVLSDMTPVHLKNDLYETQGNDFLILQFPLFSSRSSVLDHAQRDPRFYDVKANLQHFRDVYRRVLNEKETAAQLREDYTRYGQDRPPSDLRGKDFDAFVDRYYRYISGQLASVERTLSSLAR